MKRAAVASLGVVMFAGCDLGGREAEALRQRVAAQELLMANLQRDNDRLRAELVAQQEQQMREAVVRGPAADPATIAALRLDASAPAPTPVDPALGIVCADERCTVPRASFEALFADPAALTRQVRIVPQVQEGVVRGFKLFAIRDGSAFAAVGLQNGDLITALGGRALGDVEQALAAYAALKGRDEWTIAGERGGAAFERTIVIGGSGAGETVTR